MNFTSLNFTLDVILVFISLGVLIRDFPLRTACLTLLCILSYVVPLSLLEDVLEKANRSHAIAVASQAAAAAAPVESSTPPPATATESETPGEPSNEAPSPDEAAREQVRQMAKGNPAEVTKNVAGIWNTALNGLSGVPGSGPNNSAPVDVNQMVADRAGDAMGVSSSSADTGPLKILGIPMPGWGQTMLDGRFGHHTLRQNELRSVEMFWLFARGCLLAGAAYFMLFDWKITMSIVSLCVIPIHYYMVLFYFLGTNWRRTEPWWGAMAKTGLALLVLVLIALVIRFILAHTGKGSFHIPDPNRYRARLGGAEYDYLIMGNNIELAGITLDLAASYVDPKSPGVLKFTSGAAIEFVPRPQAGQ